MTLGFLMIVAFVAPAILPGAKAWHKGYNLYNGGLAYGILGFLLFNFLYTTMGVPAPNRLIVANAVYDHFGRSYRAFGNIFFVLLFIACIIAGWFLNERSFKGLSVLFHDTGYQSNFASKYGMPLCLMNTGLFGLQSSDWRRRLLDHLHAGLPQQRRVRDRPVSFGRPIRRPGGTGGWRTLRGALYGDIFPARRTDAVQRRIYDGRCGTDPDPDPGTLFRAQERPDETAY